jgi:hypothetical protein
MQSNTGRDTRLWGVRGRLVPVNHAAIAPRPWTGAVASPHHGGPRPPEVAPAATSRRVAGAWARTWRLLGRDPAPGGGEGSPHTSARRLLVAKYTGCCVGRLTGDRPGTVGSRVEEGRRGGGEWGRCGISGASNLPSPLRSSNTRARWCVPQLCARYAHAPTTARGVSRRGAPRARAHVSQKKTEGLAPTTKTRPLARPSPARAPSLPHVPSPPFLDALSPPFRR